MRGWPGRSHIVGDADARGKTGESGQAKPQPLLPLYNLLQSRNPMESQSAKEPGRVASLRPRVGE